MTFSLQEHPKMVEELREGDFTEKQASALMSLFAELVSRLEQTMKTFREEDRAEREKDRERLDKIDDRFEKIDDRLDKIDDRFEKIDDRFEKIDNKIDVRFDKLDKKIDYKIDHLGREIRKELRVQRQEHKEDIVRSNKETRALVSELASEHAETRRWVLATLFALVLLVGSAFVTVLVNMLPLS